ncbi:MAG: hypothetical protein EA402_02960 [Planctomycetota bacterium]|nr:MAG: hypothetical protein EA402_02960 [Planctomycetota bacterium]
MSPPSSDAIDALFNALTGRWSAFPEPQRSQLRERIEQALNAAAEAQPEVITVAGHSTRPQVLRLHPLATASSDDWYQQEWTEFAVAAEGGAWIVYRRRDGQHYAAPFSEGSALPETLMKSLEPCLVMAIYGGDGS